MASYFNSLSAPLFAHWEVTEFCNHRCQYCYNFWRSDKKYQATKEKKSVLHGVYSSVVNEIIKHKIYKVIVTGGEPLSVFDSIYPYLLQLSEHGVFLNINSNLTLLTDDIAEKISKLRIPILTSLQSYDEKTTNMLTQSPSAYKRIISGIKCARKHRIGIAVNMVISQKNIDHIFQTAKLAKELGVSKFSVTKVCRPLSCQDFSNFILTPSQLRYAFAELRRVEKEIGIEVDSLSSYPVCLFEKQEDYEHFGEKRCSAGRNSIAIGVKGDIRPCPHLSYSYGNISEGLDIAWKKMASWRDYSCLPKKCKPCFFAPVCRGGCKAEVLANKYKIKDPDPFADFSRALCVHPRKNESLNTASITKDKTYFFPINFFIRKESFGGLLFNGKSEAYVDDTLYRFIIKNSKKPVVLQDIAKALHVSQEKAKRTLAYLQRIEMLVESKL